MVETRDRAGGGEGSDEAVVSSAWLSPFPDSPRSSHTHYGVVVGETSAGRTTVPSIRSNLRSTSLWARVAYPRV
jgi:hypothetical protein